MSFKFFVHFWKFFSTITSFYIWKLFLNRRNIFKEFLIIFITHFYMNMWEFSFRLFFLLLICIFFVYFHQIWGCLVSFVSSFRTVSFDFFHYICFNQIWIFWIDLSLRWVIWGGRFWWIYTLRSCRELFYSFQIFKTF